MRQKTFISVFNTHYTCIQCNELHETPKNHKYEFDIVNIYTAYYLDRQRLIITTWYTIQQPGAMGRLIVSHWVSRFVYIRPCINTHTFLRLVYVYQAVVSSSLSFVIRVSAGLVNLSSLSRDTQTHTSVTCRRTFRLDGLVAEMWSGT